MVISYLGANSDMTTLAECPFWRMHTITFKLQNETLKPPKAASSIIVTTMSLTLRSSAVPISTPLFLIVIIIILLPLSGTATRDKSADLHKVLNKYGLPAGLFPQSVRSYNLDQSGRLEVHLDSPCLAQYETRVFFDSVVRANLRFGQLKVLEGMSRQELFLWFPVRDIIVTDPSSGLILIDIGLAFKHLSLSRFEDPPICRSLSGLMLKVGGRKGVGFIDQ